jgi:putative ATP-binding cassette transporter
LRWFVDNFGIIADWRATLLRVMGFRNTLLTFESSLQRAQTIKYEEKDDDELELEGAAVAKPRESAAIDPPELTLKPGDRVLVVDRTRSGPSPLLCALAGLWPWGNGRIRVPAGKKLMFLRERPYFPVGSLLAALAYPDTPDRFSREDVAAALERTGLAHLQHDLDRSARWEQILSSDEQARLGIARLLLHRPKWVFSEDLPKLLERDDRSLIASIFERELADSILVSITRRRSTNPLYNQVRYLESA